MAPLKLLFGFRWILMSNQKDLVKVKYDASNICEVWRSSLNWLIYAIQGFGIERLIFLEINLFSFLIGD